MFSRQPKPPAPSLNALEVQVAKLVTVRANGLGLVAAPIVLILILLILVIASAWGGMMVRNGFRELTNPLQEGSLAAAEPPEQSTTASGSASAMKAL